MNIVKRVVRNVAFRGYSSPIVYRMRTYGNKKPDHAG